MLDISSDFPEGSPEVHLWGLDPEGRRILIRDGGFLPYFYLVLDGTREGQDVAEEIEKIHLPFVKKLEAFDRSYFGKPVKALRIVVSNPSLIDEYARKLAKISGIERRLEDDLRYSYRYLVDNNLSPCAWYDADVDETENEIKASVQIVCKLRSKLMARNRQPPPCLRVLSLSMIAHSSAGAPKPQRNTVDVISCATNTGIARQFVTQCSDKPTLEAFMNYLRSFDPDVIATFDGNRSEWPYLLERAKSLGIKLHVGRLDTEPHRSAYGHISVTGRANVDFYDLSDEIEDVKVKTLENIGVFLDLPEAKAHPIEDVDFADYWNDPKRRIELLEFSIRRAKLILGLADKLLGFAEELSSLSGLPLDQVGAAAVGFRIESYIIRQASSLGELIPERLQRSYFPYQGGLVLKPKPGLHEDVEVLDFKSMYPALMIAYNISADTYVAPGEPNPPEGVNTAPEVGHRFRKAPPGLYSRILKELILTRDQVRTEMKAAKPGTPTHRVLDARQRAIKVMTNAVYGYSGWIGARWYLREVAEAAAAWGRYTITVAIDLAKNMGLNVIYGDTDSIFVELDREKTGRFTDEVEARLGLEIIPDEEYTRIIFTEAKKRYAGLLPDGSLDIVGLEVARGDWTGIAKVVQEGVLGIVLRDKDPDKAAAYVREEISKLRDRKVPLRQLIIWKTLTKDPKEYIVKAAHVEAARFLTEKGWEITAGDKVGYVIAKGEGKPHRRAIPYAFVSMNEIDLEYYEKQQIVPAILRILSMFKVTEQDLLPKAR